MVSLNPEAALARELFDYSPMFSKAVKLTHIPTGESVTVTNQFHRSNNKMIKAANQILLSRLTAMQNGIERSSKEVAVYELPDNEPFPYDLGRYKAYT